MLPYQPIPRREKGEGVGFLVEVQSLEGEEDWEKIEAQDMIQPLQQQYREVFQLIQGLPHPREHEHAIILKGISHISVHPYYSPQLQKDDIERLIREMEEARIIRPSDSPFFNLVLLVQCFSNRFLHSTLRTMWHFGREILMD